MGFLTKLRELKDDVLGPARHSNRYDDYSDYHNNDSFGESSNTPEVINPTNYCSSCGGMGRTGGDRPNDIIGGCCLVCGGTGLAE
jgi:hypothetical protein